LHLNCNFINYEVSFVPGKMIDLLRYRKKFP